MHRFKSALTRTTLSAALLAATAFAANASAANSAAAQAAAHTDTTQAETLFRDANQFWSHEFTSGGSYRAAQLQLFDGHIRGVCGAAGTLTGPFYCPAEMKVYLDQNFLQQVTQRTPGPADDFALGYVIGHEMGLHIQNLVGTLDLVEQARENSAPALSARTWMTQELQADCFAGLWVRSAVMHGKLKPIADPAAVLSAVSSVTQQHEAHLAQGETMVDPLLTYGTVAQRLKWFQRGMDGGRFNDCDTFSAEAAGKL
jgi:uncharacterized protein